MPLCTWEKKIRRVLPDWVDKFKILFWTGGVHAIPCERPVHHGRPGLQFYVHPGRSWVHRSRPGEQASDAPTEPHPAVVRGFCGSDHCLLHVQGLHAYQTAVSWTVSFFFTSLSSLTLFIPSNSERVASPSPSNIGAERSKAGVGQEKPDKNAHISTVNITVLPSLSDTVSLSSSPIYSESSTHPSFESSTLCSLSSSMKSIYPMLQKANISVTVRCIFVDSNVKTTQ